MAPSSPLRPRGRLRLELRLPGGRPLEVREAHNTVVQSGAQLLGALFSGTAVGPVNGLAVGTNNIPLTPPYSGGAPTIADADGHPLLLKSAAPLGSDAFLVETLADEQLVRVTVRGTIPTGFATPPTTDSNTVYLAEAALGVLAPDQQSLAVIYNRVVFDPIPKGRDHELAFYWEIDFPYGE